MARTDPLPARMETAVAVPHSASRAGPGILTILGWIAFHTLLAVVAFITLFPIAWLLLGSLQTIKELYDGVNFLPAVPQFQNYYIAWTKGGFSVYIPNSLFYSTVAVVAILFIASMAGYALARIDFPGRAAIMMLILAIVIVPLPATFVALYKLLVDLGLANTRIGYLLVLVTAGLPISIFILRGFFMRQPKELEDAAILDGCSAF